MSTTALTDLSQDELAELAARVRQEYEELKAKGLKLDLTRGKPSSEQLDFSNELLTFPRGSVTDRNGVDVRNYGNLEGILDIREIFAELLNVDVRNIVAQDASSLNIMFDLISWAYIFGTVDSERPWKDEETVKWLCPVPGYDRHFAITETLGFEMINVPALADGSLDIDAIRQAVQDPQVKGMWIVPIFANPSGVTVSDAEIDALVSMETAAPDFRILWDNAYALHTLTDSFPEVPAVVARAAQAGNPNRVWGFASTSKITFAGAGVSFFYSSEENLAAYAAIAGKRGIGPNKVNQLAHAQFFGDAEGVRQLMLRHSASLAPKFAAVLEILETRLGQYDFASWTSPEGGYFISVDVLPGTAARTVALAKEAGIALTGSGSSFPYHRDPEDKNIRLAPSLPPISELEPAMQGFAIAALLAAVEKLGA